MSAKRNRWLPTTPDRSREIGSSIGCGQNWRRISDFIRRTDAIFVPLRAVGIQQDSFVRSAIVPIRRHMGGPLHLANENFAQNQQARAAVDLSAGLGPRTTPPFFAFPPGGAGRPRRGTSAWKNTTLPPLAPPGRARTGRCLFVGAVSGTSA